MEILPKPPSVRGPQAWFTGDVYFDVIAPGAPTTQSRGRVNAVHLAPGARTAWHRHANGQTLHVTEGVGLTGCLAGTCDHTARHSAGSPARSERGTP